MFFNTNSLFLLLACLALDHNELVLFHFLRNRLCFKSTLYLSCKSPEVFCETDSMKEFAISAASFRFLSSMNF